ncbi:PTS sugar transporter subunit IIA [Clostridium saccharoperbutylacetonicum]|uniref:PTS system, glucose subfamily, IIA subunit n=1 Tax=Clostridium saccharoperbutylacetonicum N1-4(HMT) TaxID=931276 RepID=M1MP61_9CLOT|nr:PTS glucose transporter subunit IIA [Clostridium saccharoperbutylacetonicum]AGF58008.1 PTS system, glucose subfamily, IIA subunit [Clostridium saccharoperbutylacetonicum N1-4(HMT)]AQR96688.1 glucose-specific phosphotransferase enzyme IIA component [Clostridium saccharoperbutylacetonicum]NRT61219.1 PTS system D-glucosamine-specific IIA component/PTS system glucose-specific IIA component [Clostridium saccharoperbutylacetonicum]NSB24536.1 PTS system D-glucosamine-specific IIA component/PTS syst
MFKLFNKKQISDLILLAPADGAAIDLSKVPDPVFAQKMAGDGIAIDITGDTIVAPADGTVSMIFKTKHAFALSLDNGIELLIHIGIDTVSLKGDGFEQLVEEGTSVKAGTPIIKIDRDFILKEGFSLISPVLITNPDIVSEIVPMVDKNVIAAKDEVAICKFPQV